MSNLILILGDQLSPNIAALRDADPARDRVLMAEVQEEATYVRHHKKKIAFLFSAMRHFAEDLRADGWTVDYVSLDDPDNTGSFSGEVERFAAAQDPDAIIVTEPGEWRVRCAIEDWQKAFDCAVEIRADDRFIATHDEFQTWAEGRKQLRMEYFYREMRRKTGLLMDGDDPEGGKWNYDADNRKPAKADLFMPTPLQIAPDEITQSVLDLVADRF
ncbi:MAG: cryptochrome/photolyase family protein, partial [Pseudomonadota bacterium]